MGRRKIEIKRIENSGNRQATYSKTKNGILKKAKEITVLCDAKVSLVIFAGTGKMIDWCSPSTNLSNMLELYQKKTGKKLWDAKHEGKIQEEENRQFSFQLQQLEMEVANNARTMENRVFQLTMGDRYNAKRVSTASELGR